MGGGAPGRAQLRHPRRCILSGDATRSRWHAAVPATPMPFHLCANRSMIISPKHRHHRAQPRGRSAPRPATMPFRTPVEPPRPRRHGLGSPTVTVLDVRVCPRPRCQPTRSTISNVRHPLAPRCPARWRRLPCISAGDCAGPTQNTARTLQRNALRAHPGRASCEALVGGARRPCESACGVCVCVCLRVSVERVPIQSRRRFPVVC